MVTRRALRHPAIATTASELAVRPPFWNVRHIAELGAGILAITAAVVAAVVIAGSSDSGAVGGADLSWEAAAAIRYPGLTAAEAAEAARWTALAGEFTAPAAAIPTAGLIELTPGEVAEAARLRALNLADSIDRLPVGEAAGGVAGSELPGVLHAGGAR